MIMTVDGMMIYISHNTPMVIHQVILVGITKSIIGISHQELPIGIGGILQEVIVILNLVLNPITVVFFLKGGNKSKRSIEQNEVPEGGRRTDQNRRV